MSRVGARPRWRHPLDQTCAKRFVAGTHRIRPPAETVAEFGRLMPRMGITRLANITGLDWIGVPVYNGIRPNSRSLSVSQGKGADHDAAKASALMETIEYWHAEHVEAPLCHDSYLGLRRRAAVVDVARLPLRAGAELRLAAPFIWIEGFDLLADHPVWVPFETVTLNKVGLDYANTTFRLNSNGLASGNHLLEAILHGICELVERDAVTLWWTEGLAAADRTKLDLGSVADPLCRQVLDRFARAGLIAAAWDITSDVGIPSFQCCVLEQEPRPVWRPFGACWGWGTHPDAAIALLRALTEAAQSRLTVIVGSRDDSFRDQYATQHDAERLHQTREVFFSLPPRKRFGAVSSLAGASLDGDVAATLAALGRVGIESVVVVDLTQPALDIPVAKVIIPGLEHSVLFPGYAPGPRALARRSA